MKNTLKRIVSISLVLVVVLGTLAIASCADPMQNDVTYTHIQNDVTYTH